MSSDPLPLSGRTVLVTRSRQQAASLSERLERLGARVLSIPTIELVEPDDWAPLDKAIAELNTFDWIVFTSVNGVEWFFSRLRARGFTSSLPDRTRIAAIGSATAAALEDRGVSADIVPMVFRAESLAEAMPLSQLAGRRVLIARAQKAREVLPETLEGAGAQVVVAPCYRTIVPNVDAAELEARLERGEIDLVTFTSSSTVVNFASLFPEGRAAGLLAKARVACIGPITAATVRELGIEPAVSDHYTIGGLVETVVRVLSHP